MTRRLGTIALIALLSFSTGLRAQESASSGIVGQVVDTTKGAMPGATVTVINTGTNAQRVTTTDAEGRFSVPNLLPATYTVRVELSGFATTEVKGSDAAQRRGRPADHHARAWPTSPKTSRSSGCPRCCRRPTRR